MKLKEILFLIILFSLPPSLCSGWGNGHRIIATEAVPVLMNWEQDVWDKTAYDPIWEINRNISEGLQNQYSYLPDNFWGKDSNCTIREKISPYLYAESGEEYTEPAPSCSPDYDPQVTVYHIFDWDDPSTISFLYRGATWYFEQAVNAFRNDDPMKAAQVLGSFIHAIEDSTYPYRALNGIEGEGSVDYYLADSEKGEPNFVFWKFNDSAINASIQGYSPVILGKSVESAAQACAERIKKVNTYTRDLMPDFVAAHLEDDWENRVVGSEATSYLNLMAQSAARLLADVFHTAFYLAYESNTDYVTTLDLHFTSCPEASNTTTEYVDLSLGEGRVHSLNATGYIEGPLTLNVERAVDIKTGTYAGWMYRRAAYSLAGYTGKAYTVHDNNTGKVWGRTTGDIHAVTRRAGSKRTWYITSIKGEQVEGKGTVNLQYEGSAPSETTTEYTGTPLEISTNIRFDGTASGRYSGSFMNTSTAVRTPELTPEHGFALVNYYVDYGSGKGWAYFDNRQNPLLRRHVTYDGPFFGIQKRHWIRGTTCGENPVYATIEHAGSTLADNIHTLHVEKMGFSCGACHTDPSGNDYDMGGSSINKIQYKNKSICKKWKVDLNGDFYCADNSTSTRAPEIKSCDTVSGCHGSTASRYADFKISAIFSARQISHDNSANITRMELDAGRATCVSLNATANDYVKGNCSYNWTIPADGTITDGNTSASKLLVEFPDGNYTVDLFMDLGGNASDTASKDLVLPIDTYRNTPDNRW